MRDRWIVVGALALVNGQPIDPRDDGSSLRSAFLGRREATIEIVRYGETGTIWYWPRRGLERLHRDDRPEADERPERSPCRGLHEYRVFGIVPLIGDLLVQGSGDGGSVPWSADKSSTSVPIGSS